MEHVVGKMTNAVERKKGKAKGGLTTNEAKSTSQFKEIRQSGGLSKQILRESIQKKSEIMITSVG